MKKAFTIQKCYHHFQAVSIKTVSIILQFIFAGGKKRIQVSVTHSSDFVSCLVQVFIVGMRLICPLQEFVEVFVIAGDSLNLERMRERKRGLITT